VYNIIGNNNITDSSQTIRFLFFLSTITCGSDAKIMTYVVLFVYTNIQSYCPHAMNENNDNWFFDGVCTKKEDLSKKNNDDDDDER